MLKPLEAYRLPMNGTQIDWPIVVTILLSPSQCKDIDDLAEALSDAAIDGAIGREAVPSLMIALRVASDLLIRRSAYALAITAPNGSRDAIEALNSAIERSWDHAFLAPSLVDALSLLAMRDSLARSHLRSFLLRLTLSENRYLLITGAKIVGRMDSLWVDEDLREKLNELTRSDDQAVLAEVRQQIALIKLADALLSDDRRQLREHLSSARAAFARAEATEEHRPDAAMFRILLDALLDFLNLGSNPAAIASIIAGHEMSLLQVNRAFARDYFSDQSLKRAQRVMRIVSALHRSSVAATEAGNWLNFHEALSELAHLYVQIKFEPDGSPAPTRLRKALDLVADTILAESLGPILRQAVGLRKLTRIRETYLISHSNDAISLGLEALENAVAAISAQIPIGLPPDMQVALNQLAGHLHLESNVLVGDFMEASAQNRVQEWAEELGIRGRLPIELPDIYGQDATVDEIVRHVLPAVRERVGNLSFDAWQRLVEILVHLIGFASIVRDDLPDYVRATEDGGLGRQASEGVLQKHLHEFLRGPYRNAVSFEASKIAGGRVDLKITLPVGCVPIEVKHEFSSIDPAHIRNSYLAQPDAYAAATLGVSFLLILDLRAANAASHQASRKLANKSDKLPEIAGLYGLRDSFWVDSLPADPQLPNARENAVIVGLIPGNRPRPSSTTKYSERPKSARKKSSETTH